MKFLFKKFTELSNEELYAILKLRSEVFVVEQNCAYLDLDNQDQKSLHLLGFIEDKLVAYARIIAPGDYYTEAAIGRIVTAKEIRLTGAGKELLKIAINKTTKLFPAKGIKIMAQCYLREFYKNFGFIERGEEFLEDGIPHIEMTKA